MRKLETCLERSRKMDREKLITIAIGLLVGVGLASSYFVASKYLPSFPGTQKISVTPPKNDLEEKTKGAAVSLTLDKPEDNISTTQATLTLSGKTAPGARIILFGSSDEKIASADASGNFSSSLKLEEGENAISVTAVFGAGETAVVKRNVTLEIAQ